MKRLTVTGKIVVRDYGDTMDVLFVADDETAPLGERLEEMSGKKCSVRYWISEREAPTDQIKENALRSLLGDAEVEFSPRYSDITGHLWTDENLNVGGHDLLRELKSNAGKWLHLEADIHN